MTDATQHDGRTTDESDDSRDDGTGGDRPADERAHLADVEDGCGCAEVWEHLSEERTGRAD